MVWTGKHTGFVHGILDGRNRLGGSGRGFSTPKQSGTAQGVCNGRNLQGGSGGARR